MKFQAGILRLDKSVLSAISSKFTIQCKL